MVREFQWSLRNGVDFFKHNLLFLLGPYTLLPSVLPFVFQRRAKLVKTGNCSFGWESKIGEALRGTINDFRYTVSVPKLSD